MLHSSMRKVDRKLRHTGSVDDCRKAGSPQNNEEVKA